MKSDALRHLTETAAQHIALAKSCKALASHFGSLAECAKSHKSEMKDQETDAGTLYANASNEYATQSEAHTAIAKSCLDACKALKESKKAAMGGDFDLDELMPMPDGLSRVTPTSPHVRAVLRPGQRELPTPLTDPVNKIIFGEEIVEGSGQ
jgi:hypothetical protein